MPYSVSPSNNASRDRITQALMDVQSPPPVTQMPPMPPPMQMQQPMGAPAPGAPAPMGGAPPPNMLPQATPGLMRPGGPLAPQPGAMPMQPGAQPMQQPMPQQSMPQY